MENEAVMMLFSAVGRLMFVLIALFVVVSMLRILDKLGGYPFKEQMKIIRKDSRALAIYSGLRLLAVGLAVGLVFS
jgi:hypothetical protein